MTFKGKIILMLMSLVSGSVWAMDYMNTFTYNISPTGVTQYSGTAYYSCNRNTTNGSGNRDRFIIEIPAGMKASVTIKEISRQQSIYTRASSLQTSLVSGDTAQHSLGLKGSVTYTFKETGSVWVRAQGVAMLNNGVFYAMSVSHSYTITATYSKLEYANVAFESNGGTYCAPRTFTVGEQYGTLPGPTRTGYVFGGWYSNTSLTTRITSSSTVSKTITKLYAKWNSTYQIVFHANGGSGTMSPQTCIVNQNCSLNKNRFTYSGYHFLGWSRSSYATIATYTDGGTVKIASTGTYDFYAVWGRDDWTCTISFAAGGGSGYMSSVAKTISGDVGYYVLPTCGFTKTGYVFAGWNVSDPCVASLNPIAPAGRLYEIGCTTLRLTATWKPCTYTLKANPNGGTLLGGNFGASNGTTGSSSVTVTYNAKAYSTLGRASRSNYTFMGWYTSPSGGTRVFDASGKYIAGTYWSYSGAWQYAGNLTVYAQWAPKRFTVTLHAAGSADEKVIVSYGVKPAAVPIPRRDGYNFTGYYDANGVKYFYANGQPARSWYKTTGATLTAGWTPKKFTVILNKNNRESNESFIATFGEKPSAVSVPYKGGYKFNGYYDANGVKYFYANGLPARTWYKTTGATLTAGWTAIKYKVTFNPNNGEKAFVVPVVFGQKPASVAVPRRNGYDFTGYYDTGFTGYYDQWSTKVFYADGKPVCAWSYVADRTLTAGWTPKKFTVTLNHANGEENSKVIVSFAQKPAAVAVPKRNGYKFTGYYDVSGVKYFYANGQPARSWYKTTGATLTAQWEATLPDLVMSARLICKVRADESLVHGYSQFRMIADVHDDVIECDETNNYSDSVLTHVYNPEEGLCKRVNYEDDIQTSDISIIGVTGEGGVFELLLANGGNLGYLSMETADGYVAKMCKVRESEDGLLLIADDDTVYLVTRDGEGSAML